MLEVVLSILEHGVQISHGFFCDLVHVVESAVHQLEKLTLSVRGVEKLMLLATRLLMALDELAE